MNFRSPVLKGLLVSFLLPAIFLSNFLFNLDKPMQFPEGGVFHRQGLFHSDQAHITLTYKHFINIFSKGNFADILTVPMFYGLNYSLLFSEALIFQSILAFLINIFSQNILVTFNLVSYLTLVASFFAMFIFVEFLTGNFLASVLASIIFVFNPFLFARFPEHISYHSLLWLPLIFLFFEKFLNKQKPFYGFLFFVFLTLNMFTVLTYNVFLSVLLPIYFLIRWYQLKFSIKKFVNWGTILGMILFLSLSAGIYYIYFGLLYSKNSINRGLEETSYYSAWPTDFSIASNNNLIYGDARNILSEIFPKSIFMGVELAEHNLFWGVTPFILFILSFWILRKSEHKRYWKVSLVMVIVSSILALGPKIYLTNELTIPGPYQLLYVLNPLLHFLRVASRFGIFSYFFLSIISALVLVQMIKKLRPGKAVFISILIICLVLLEYWNKPWDFMDVSQSTKIFYQKIDQNPKIKVILELPMGNYSSLISVSRDQLVDTKYMLYASFLHSKTLLNGYSSYIPPKYTRRVEYLSINFPTKAKLIMLKNWGVSAIVLHKEEFKSEEIFENIKNSLKDYGVPETYSIDSLSLFDLTAWNSP